MHLAPSSNKLPHFESYLNTEPKHQQQLIRRLLKALRALRLAQTIEVAL